MGGVCFCLGLSACWRLRSRAALLRGWQRGLSGMYAACAYSRSTCAQILHAGGLPCLRQLARAVELNGADAGRLFAEMPRDPLLRHEEETVLREAMNAVSSGSREEIAAALSYALERFRAFCADSEKKRDSDARMYMTLGLLSGLCVFLILC